MKPQLAKDVDLDKMVYPCWGLPKIDGVRALNYFGDMMGRSLEFFKGFGQTEFWRSLELDRLDGEMIAGDDPKDTNLLCNRSTSALGSFKDITERAHVTWWVFDDTTLPKAPYRQRYEAAAKRVKVIQQTVGHKYQKLVNLVPYTIILNKEQAEEFISKCLDEGYEGAIFRNPDAPAKQDRPTAKGQEFMRYKPWMDSEALVTGIVEGETNNNVKTINALGRSERSSHKENKVPNGMVGKLKAVVLEDIYHPTNKTLLFAKGLEITLGTGKATDKMLLAWFKDPSLIVNQVVKFQHMAHGVKDLPRFGAYVSHRMKEDR